MKKLIITAAALTLTLSGASAQESTNRTLNQEELESLTLFRDFLSYPNDAHNGDDILRMVEWLEPQLTSRGFSVQRLKTPGAPILLAERGANGAKRTALIYLQADGQPVDPSKWNQPSPWQATFKRRLDDGSWTPIEWPRAGDAVSEDWRIFARSASDSKGPMTQFLRALDRLRGDGLEPAYNLKVFIDTEEELGSPHLPEAVEANKDMLASDFLLIFDGPPHASNKPTVTFGARGVSTITLTTYGPKAPQHSGHYGNFVPNPALALAKLLASMNSDDGRVRIKGFYDGIKLTKDVKKILAAVPDDEEKILAEMGLIRHDNVAPSLQEAIQYPSLNIRGMASAWIGASARTIIPDTATAEIDIRTVKESDPARLIGLVRRHVEQEGYYVIDRAPTDEERLAHPRIATLVYEISYGAFRSDFDASAGRVARSGLKSLYGEEPILIRSFGGSIPIAPLVETLGISAAVVPTVNIDNNQHSPNENIRLGEFLEGIDRLEAVLTAIPADEP